MHGEEGVGLDWRSKDRVGGKEGRQAGTWEKDKGGGLGRRHHHMSKIAGEGKTGGSDPSLSLA